jgi:hypothetical protein
VRADDHEHGGLRYVTPGTEPAVFSARADVVFATPTPAGELCGLVEAFLRDLQGRLSAAGCVLVGHVKGTLDSADQGSFSFSVTSLSGEARCTSPQSGAVSATLLTINVIVFGVPETELAGLVTRSWESCVPAATSWPH